MKKERAGPMNSSQHAVVTRPAAHICEAPRAAMAAGRVLNDPTSADPYRVGSSIAARLTDVKLSRPTFARRYSSDAVQGTVELFNEIFSLP